MEATTRVLTCLLRALYVARGSHVELTRRSRQRSAGSRGLYTGIKAYFRRAATCLAHGHAPRARRGVRPSWRALSSSSRISTPREPRPETRESGETRRRLSPGHISVCNEQNRQPSMSSSLFLTHENTRVSICTAQNEVPCCPELMTTRQSERGFSRP